MPPFRERTVTRSRRVTFAWLCLILGSVGAPRLASAQQPASAPSITRTDVMKQVLPPGDFRTIEAVVVELAPGAAAPLHRHDVAVLAYVLEGEIQNRFSSGAPQLHRAGESWWEAPGTVHHVARNPSTTNPTRFLVMYIAEAGKANSVRLDSASTPARLR